MQKLFSFLLIFVLTFGASNFSFAQNKTTAKTPATKSAPVKKDGTPDMRYKENKQKEKPVHLKKDGTPDKRYKENK